MKRNYSYHKPTDRFYAIFYCLVALGLFIWGFYKKSALFLIAAIILFLVDYYWIMKALKKI
jgi:Mg2+/citrate symporter